MVKPFIVNVQAYIKLNLTSILNKFIIKLSVGYTKTFGGDALAHIKKEHIQIVKSVENYEMAITKAAQPLVNDDYITEDYIQQMLDAIEEHGTYIVLADKFALPHARPSEAVKKTGLSLLVVQDGVDLKDNDIYLFIVLAAKDSTTHTKALQSLANFLMEKKNIETVINCESTEEIASILEERWK